MQPTRTVETKHGPLVIRGDTSGFRPDRPLLFMIRGLFPEFDLYDRLGESFPNADFAFADLPGMYSPFFARNSIPTFAAAFDDLFQAEFSGRRIVVLGLSLGGAAALYLRNPAVRTVVVTDPPLQTAAAWPLVKIVRARSARHAQGAAWCRDVVGIDADTVENRDFRDALVERPIPAVVLIGEDPLGEPRPYDRLPSLITDEDRAALMRAPGVTAILVPGVGHNIPGDAPRPLVRALRRAVEESTGPHLDRSP